MPIINDGKSLSTADADIINALIGNNDVKDSAVVGRPKQTEDDTDTTTDTSDINDTDAVKDDIADVNDDDNDDDIDDIDDSDDDSDDDDDAASDRNTIVSQSIAALQAEIAQLRESFKKKDEPAHKFDANKYLLTQEEIEQVIDDPTILNKKLLDMANDFNVMIKAAQHQPEQMQAIAESVITAQNKTRDFYAANPELNTPERRTIVQMTMQHKQQQMQASGQRVDIDTLLRIVEKDVRRTLGLKRASRGKQGTANKDKGKGNLRVVQDKPSLPGGGGKGVRTSTNKNKRLTQQDYMALMLK